MDKPSRIETAVYVVASIVIFAIALRTCSYVDGRTDAYVSELHARQYADEGKNI
jgi:hypothetical protein